MILIDFLDTALLDSIKKRSQSIAEYAGLILRNFLNENSIDIVYAHNLHIDYYPLSKILVDACKMSAQYSVLLDEKKSGFEVSFGIW